VSCGGEGSAAALGAGCSELEGVVSGAKAWDEEDRRKRGGEADVVD
jgi:hypothetical protein